MPLAGHGVLAAVVGADIRQVRAALDPLCRPATASKARRPEPADPNAGLGPEMRLPVPA
jgi:urease accessory protein